MFNTDEAENEKGSFANTSEITGVPGKGTNIWLTCICMPGHGGVSLLCGRSSAYAVHRHTSTYTLKVN